MDTPLSASNNTFFLTRSEGKGPHVFEFHVTLNSAFTETSRIGHLLCQRSYFRPEWKKRGRKRLGCH
jgi:hypothetical protein